MSITWTKLFSSLDDGSTLTGEQLGTIQADVANNTVHLAGSQTVGGDKTFTGTITFSGDVTDIPKVSEFVFYEDDIVSWEDELIYYR